MKKISKLASIFSIASILIVSTGPILSSCTRVMKKNECHILSINDIHGAIAGYGEDIIDVEPKNPGALRLAREMNKVKKEFPNTLLVSAGDENSGDCWSVCDQGGTTYPILKEMGIRYAAVGNHAFEWGLDDMSSGRYDRLGRTDQTEGNYFLASNILSSNEYQNKKWVIDPRNPEFINDYSIWHNSLVGWADPYKFINLGIANVCLIGLTTQNTLIDGNQRITKQFSFIDYNAAVNYTKYLAKKELGEEKFNSIDSFILLTHCDSDYQDNILTGEAVELAARIDTDIDAIISAHSHKVGCGKIWNNKLNKAICIGQAGTAARYFLDTKLTIDLGAKHGKKVKDVSMSVTQVPIPTTKEEATNEWNQLQLTQDPDLARVSTAYATQKTVVDELISLPLSEVNLKVSVGEDGETQNDLKGAPYDGYFSGALESGAKIGHEYYGSPHVLDHFYGWATRAQTLGYAIQYWDDILLGKTLIPSIAISSQDSMPSTIKNGSICQRDMFQIQPHDNYMHFGYISLFQLANFINYSLAGDPVIGKQHAGTGFDYGEKYQYQPDLSYYVAYKDGTAEQQVTQVAFNTLDEKKKPVIKSGYLCGNPGTYGFKVELATITDDDRQKTFTNPVTEIKSPVYDSSAKYRVATELVAGVKIGKQTVDMVLPKIWVYDGAYDASGIKWGNLDRSDDPTAWKPAKYWIEAENPDPDSGVPIKLIPIIINSFNYNGGNTQMKMIKEYCNYEIVKHGFEFIGTDCPETARDVITTFCKNSNPQIREWSEHNIPTNIPWNKVKTLYQLPA